jgi:signal transduction histidine kinase
MPRRTRGDDSRMSLVRPRRAGPLAPERGDVLAALALPLVVAAALTANAIRDGRPAAILLIPAALGVLLLRRDHTRVALLLAIALAAAMPYNRALGLPVLIVLYTIASRSSWRPAAAAGAAAAMATIVAGAAWGPSTTIDREGLLGFAIGTTASCAAAVALGLYVGAHRRVLAGLREHAERLDRERELLADRAVAHERVRIAQELHDIVAHHVSLMVVKAQALGVTAGDERVSEGTDAIADLGRQAMAEMHATLRLLRAGDPGAPELSPQPGLAQLERLVDQLRGAGLEVDLTIDGDPRPLPQSVDLSAFRILQEALTNVVKHAAGARTRVAIVYREQEVELTVVDRQAEVRRAPPPERSDGHGVIGMRERAALFDGTLTTEPLDDGFKVTATLPYGPAAP